MAETTAVIGVSGPSSTRDRFPLRLLIGGEDFTFLLADSFTFSNVDPGGFEMASFSVPRDLPQVLRGVPVKLDCGMQVAWEGRVKEIQRSLGSKTLIQCEGYGAQLRDVDLSMVFVDRDLTKWGEPPTPQLIELAKENFTQNSGRVSPDPATNLPAFVEALTGSWQSPNKPASTSWYDAGPGNLIDAIYYELTSNPEAEAGAFVQEIRVAEKTSEGTPVTATGNLHPHATALFNPAVLYRYAILVMYYGTTNAGGNGAEYQALWKNLAVYGNHGLSLRGSAPYGLYTSDIVRWVAGQLPGIQVGVIPEASFYTVPHAAYYMPVEAQQIVADMAKLVGYHWGVWESLNYMTGNPAPRLDFRPYPGTGECTALARREQCAQLDIREDLSSQYNTAQVAYTEASGTQGSIEVTVDNPILDNANIPKRTVSLSLGTSTAAAAKAYGEFALVLLQQQARVLGTAMIEEPIQRSTGAQFAPWMLRAGIDRLRIQDLPSSDVWGVYNELPITRVECTASEGGSITTNVEFGQGTNLLEALTAELAQVAAITA